MRVCLHLPRKVSLERTPLSFLLHFSALPTPTGSLHRELFPASLPRGRCTHVSALLISPGLSRAISPSVLTPTMLGAVSITNPIFGSGWRSIHSAISTAIGGALQLSQSSRRAFFPLRGITGRANAWHLHKASWFSPACVLWSKNCCKFLTLHFRCSRANGGFSPP